LTENIFSNLGYSYKSSLVIFRISGDSSFDILPIFGINKKPQHRKATLYNITDPIDNSIIDQSLITCFEAPNSYTGQNVIEISCHPSPFIIKKITEIILKTKNFRYAKEGEFTKLALLNNKIDLIQAEAILDIINSKTKSQHQQAMSQLSGEYSVIYKNWRDKIINIIANFESVIDFPDEDLPIEIINNAQKEIKYLTTEISEQLKNHSGQKIKEGISIVILGDPNVGKSSLINYISQKDLSIVSNIAGTTRDIVESHIDIGGYEVIISDTAGIRKANDQIEQEGIDRAIKKSEEADIKIIILEISNLTSNNLKFYDKNSIILINKIDLKKPNITEKLAKLNPILISLQEKTNLNQIFEQIKEKIQNIIHNFDQNSIITNQRHRDSLEKILYDLKNISFSDNIEITAEKLRSITNNIAQITGEIGVDDILDVIFSKFCIGK
jgi:tRNA modification GTPase